MASLEPYQKQQTAITVEEFQLEHEYPPGRNIKRRTLSNIFAQKHTELLQVKFHTKFFPL